MSADEPRIYFEDATTAGRCKVGQTGGSGNLMCYRQRCTTSWRDSAALFCTSVVRVHGSIYCDRMHNHLMNRSFSNRTSSTIFAKAILDPTAHASVDLAHSASKETPATATENTSLHTIVLQQHAWRGLWYSYQREVYVLEQVCCLYQSCTRSLKLEITVRGICWSLSGDGVVAVTSGVCIKAARCTRNGMSSSS